MTAGLPQVWGATPEEVAASYPCDGLLPDPDGTWFRAVDVAADPQTTFRWLCQLKVAPYSYDLVDNLGRRSPRLLTPGAEQLQVGQRVMSIFRLVAFSPGEHLTILLDSAPARRLFGPFALSYVVRGTGARTSRLVVKLRMRDAAVLGGARRRMLAWGDLVMMRRQLMVLKRLAERHAAP